MPPKNRAEDHLTHRLVTIGKYAGAIIAISALLAMVGNAQWAEKKTVIRLSSDVRDLKTNIAWQNRMLNKIEKAVERLHGK